MNTQLESFFDGLKSEADLQRLVQEKREEDLYLEFKEKADPSHADLDRDDQRGFSKTLAGFANADGGALVFGIATTKSPDNPDRASALKAITNPDRFRAKLLDSILNATQPPVDGVRIEVVPGAPGAGYVKCLVPASDRPPHRAMHAEREYWRRVTNGHRRMEHYELEDVFGRRLRPVLRVGIKLLPREDPDPHEELRFTFLNEGRGLARHVGLICTLGQGRIMATNGGIRDVSALNDQRPMVQYYDFQGVVHPNGIFSSLGSAILQRPTKGAPLPLKIKWYAENMAPRDASVEIESNPAGKLL
jgi:hypothetical protein